MIKLLEKISFAEKKNGAFQANNQEDVEDIAFLHSLGYVNKFDFIQGCAATLTTRGVKELNRLQNAGH